MRRGAWHQCGDKSQIIAREMLDQNVGVGVVLSPRDLARNVAVQYSQEYRDRHADVLFDPQFYSPGVANKKLQTYEFAACWRPSAQLRTLLVSESGKLEDGLRTLSADLGVSAVICPAVMYEAGQPQIVQLNAQLFGIARRVADQLHKPLYATAALARSVTSADATTQWALGHITSLPADGWYFVFEFNNERIPSQPQLIARFLRAGLTLACTGKPVFHAFAGPMALLSPAFGVTAIGIGHSQNLWQIDLTRWGPPQQGGGGDAPARFFSTALWGTIITPDEMLQLNAQLRAQVLRHSPYSAGVGVLPPTPWAKWMANKHLVYSLASHVGHLPAGNAVHQSNNAQAILANAVTFHGQIAGSGLALRDNTNAYQQNWRNALLEVQHSCETDYAFLDLL